MSLAPINALIASVSDDMTVGLWDAATNSVYKDQILRGHSEHVRAVTFSPDGNASDDMTMRIWKVETGATCRILKGFSDRVRALSFSKDSRFVSHTTNIRARYYQRFKYVL